MLQYIDKEIGGYKWFYQANVIGYIFSYIDVCI